MKISENDPVFAELKGAVEKHGLDCGEESMEWSKPRPVWTTRGRHIRLDIKPNADFRDARDRQESDLIKDGFEIRTETIPPDNLEDEASTVVHVSFLGSPDPKDPVFVALQGVLEQFGLDSDDKLEWGYPKLAENASGYKRLEIKAVPSKSFWNSWNERGDEIKQAGIYVKDFYVYDPYDRFPYQVNNAIFWCDPTKIGISDSDLAAYRD